MVVDHKKCGPGMSMFGCVAGYLGGKAEVNVDVLIQELKIHLNFASSHG